MTASTISFGLFTSLRGSWDELVARWQEIEALGFNSAWIPDHFGFLVLAQDRELGKV